MSIQGSINTSRGKLRTFAWIAFALCAPGNILLDCWNWYDAGQNFGGVENKIGLTDHISCPAPSILNGVVTLFAFLAALTLFRKPGRLLAFIAAGSWVVGLLLTQVASWVYMRREQDFGLTTNWYEPIASLKNQVGLTWSYPARPAIWYVQWVNLGGTISTIIWVFIAIKLGKLKNDVSPEPVYVQNQSAFVANTPTYQPVVNQQSSSQGNFCSNCGAKSSGPVGGFCSSCGARL